MKRCELCKLPAKLYCESDHASLCGGCDLKVHEANFLVARHSRRLLCRMCQSPTPWEASGARLGNTVTECDKCVEKRESEATEGGRVGDVLVHSDSDGESVEEDEMSGSTVDEEEEEEGENQVVPWSPFSPVPPPPPPSSSSCSDQCSSSFCATRTLKRTREYDSDRQPQNEFVTSSPSRRGAVNEGDSVKRSKSQGSSTERM